MGLKWLWAMVDMYMILGALLGAALFALALSVNPPTKTQMEAVKPPGDIMACIEWQGHHDVDLWATSPEQTKATGYANKNGETLDLVRDDLGNSASDIVHRECQFARGLPDGRWIFNIHGYHVNQKDLEVKSDISIGHDGTFTSLDKTTLTINQGQERTIVQFQLKDGLLVQGSKIITNKLIRSG